jgi:hypothetical protein
LRDIKTRVEDFREAIRYKKENAEEERQNTGLARSTTFESVTIQVKE